MSEEFVSGCIQHKDTRHVRLYCDYMDIYKGNEHKAKIIRILETWTNSKRAEWLKENLDRLEQGEIVKEPDFWITMSYAQFKQFMYSSTGSSEDTLKKNLAELEKAKHITRRVNPDFPYGPPQYLLNTKTVQAALNKRATPPLIPELPQADTPPGNFLPPQELTPTQGVDLPPPQGENTHLPGGNFTPTQGGKTGTSNNGVRITNDSPKNATKERESVFANASTPLAFEKSHIIFEHYAGNETLYYHSACIDGHYGASEGMVLTAVGEERAPQEAICGMCQSNVHQAPFSDDIETSYHIASTAIGNDAEEDAPTVKMPAIKLNGYRQVGKNGITSVTFDDIVQAQTPVEQTPGTPALPPSADPPQFGRSSGIRSDQASLPVSVVPEPAQAESPPAGSNPVHVAPTAQATGKPEKPKRGRKNEVQLTLQEAQIKEWYEELRGVEISLSKRTVTALAALGKRTMSKDDFLSVTAILDSDKWFEEHRVGVDLYWINFHWENKIVFLQRKKSTPLDDKKPIDIYTANSMDKEKMQRRIEERRARIAARGVN